jgi:hypothetical protein
MEGIGIGIIEDTILIKCLEGLRKTTRTPQSGEPVSRSEVEPRTSIIQVRSVTA